METRIAELLSAEKATRERGLRVVAIGGGTGLSTLLKGLKRFALTPAELAVAPPGTPIICDLCAVVTVSDDGGSSGRLRKELNMLPPGDIRNCIVALSEDEALLSQLFRHRFEKGSGLEGHSFGNLFLAALTAITHDFSEAVRLSSEILLTRGHIHPATTSNIELEALMEDGTRVRGETKITASKVRIQELFLVPSDVEPLPQTLDAIARADIISIGPGSLFTSLIPNLLVHGIADAIVNSSATKVYICNLMTQANESLGLTAADHIRALNHHARRQQSSRRGAIGTEAIEIRKSKVTANTFHLRDKIIDHAVGLRMAGVETHEFTVSQEVQTSELLSLQHRHHRIAKNKPRSITHQP